MSEETRHLLAHLQTRLRAAAGRITVARLAHRALLTGGLLAALLLVLIGIEALFWIPVTWRSLCFWLLITAAVVLTAVLVARPLLRLAGLLPRPSDRLVAEQVSARHPELEDRLVNLLDLGAGRASAAPAPLLDGAMRMLLAGVQGVPLEDAASFAPARRMGRLATLPAAGLLLFVLAAPSTFQGATGRLLSPGEHFVRPAPFSLAVTPGDTK